VMKPATASKMPAEIKTKAEIVSPRERDFRLAFVEG